MSVLFPVILLVVGVSLQFFTRVEPEGGEEEEINPHAVTAVSYTHLTLPTTERV